MFYNSVLAHGDGTIINNRTPRQLTLGIFPTFWQNSAFSLCNEKFLEIWKGSNIARENSSPFENAFGFCICRYIDFLSLLLSSLLILTPILTIILIVTSIHKKRWYRTAAIKCIKLPNKLLKTFFYKMICTKICHLGKYINLHLMQIREKKSNEVIFPSRHVFQLELWLAKWVLNSDNQFGSQS